MPDGDVVYHGVGRGFSKVYKALCEGQFDDEYIASMLAKALRNCLKTYGNVPLTIVEGVYSSVVECLNGGDILNFGQESAHIDALSQKLYGHRRGIALAIDASKAYVLRLSENEPIPLSSARPLIREYVSRVLDAEFFERIPLLNHHNDLTPEAIEERIKEIRPCLDIKLESIVEQLIRTSNPSKLHKPKSQAPIYMHDFSKMSVIPRRNQGGGDDEDRI